MSSFLPDTSVMIATVCAWHEHHVPATREVQRLLDRGHTMVVAGPALIEAYAVLTRLPPPHRLSPTDSLSLLQANFMSRRQIVALDGKGYKSLLLRAPAEHVSGGKTYDSVILACAIKGGASTLVTLNRKDFLAFQNEGVEIVIPDL